MSTTIVLILLCISFSCSSIGLPFVYGILAYLGYVPNIFEELLLGSKTTPKEKESTSTTKTTGDVGNVVTGTSGKTNITYYGGTPEDDNGEGFVGVDLFKHGNAGMTFQGKRLYPVAVHHDHAKDFLWKILEVQGKGVKKVYGHVVDICNRKDGPCKNVSKNGITPPFLVDLHSTAWKEAGSSDGVTTGTYKVVGELRAPELPKHVWLKGQNTYVMCRCKSKRCEGSDQEWVKVSECK